jgi:hypothetical protein
MKIRFQQMAVCHKILLKFLFASPLLLFSQTTVSPPLRSSPPSVKRPQSSSKPLSLSDINSAFASLTPPVSWRQINIRPYISYQLVSSDGILRVPGEPTYTITQNFSAGANAELGKHWNLSYSFTRSWYSTRLIADHTSHNANLSGGTTKGNWTLGVYQSYTSSGATLVETGQPTPEVSYATGGNIAYQVGARTQLDLQLNRNTRDSDIPSGSSTAIVPNVEQWSGTGSVRYRFSPKLDISVGMSLGSDSISNSSDMTTSKPQLTISWRPTNKLSFSGQAGIETREFQSDNTNDLNSDVYSASATYQPTVYTTLSVAGNKSVAPSYFVNRVSKMSGWSVNLQQRMLQRLYFGLGYTHGRTSYLVTDKGFTIGRDDDFNSYNVGISTTLLRRGSVSLSYVESRNSSNDSVFQFTSHQISMELAYRFYSPLKFGRATRIFPL